VHARHPESPGLNARLAYGAVQGVTWLLALGPIGREGWPPPRPEWLGLPLITIILLLCHQINKGIRMIIIIDVFWLHNWFQAENNNMNIFFLMNGNIFNYTLASEQYNWNGGSAYAIPPNPPGIVFCPLKRECEPLFTQSYINAYNTAFNQPVNSQEALYNYYYFTPNDTNSNFIPGTFGYYEGYTGSIGNSESNIIIHRLQDDLNVYSGTPYLFVSAGSGGGSGFIYLDWIIVTYGVPYIINVG